MTKLGEETCRKPRRAESWASCSKQANVNAEDKFSEEIENATPANNA